MNNNFDNVRAVGIEPETTMGEMVITKASKTFKRFAVGVTIAGLLMTSGVTSAVGYEFSDAEVQEGMGGRTSIQMTQDSIEAGTRTHLYNPAYALRTGLDPNETEAERKERLARNDTGSKESAGLVNPEYLNIKPTQQTQTLRPLSERIFVHQKRVQFDVPPVIENGRTLVPIRMVAQELGAEVEWLNDTQEVIITKDGKRIVLTLGSKNVTVDGVKSTIDVPAKAVDGRTLVPIRFISENMNIPVEYIETSQEVHIG